MKKQLSGSKEAVFNMILSIAAAGGYKACSTKAEAIDLAQTAMIEFADKAAKRRLTDERL
jgi:hypothetical protein